MKSINYAIRTMRATFTNQQEGTGSSEDSEDEHARPKPTDSLATAELRQQVVALVASQANTSPLQMVENLARGNRQIAALAAIVAAQAGREVNSVTHSVRGANASISANTLPPGFVETGIKFFIRRKHFGAFSEPDFKVRHVGKAKATSSAFPSNALEALEAAELPGRLTKTEMLVKTLIAACERANISPAGQTSMDISSDSMEVAHPGDFLHQTPLVDSMRTLCRLIGMNRHASAASAPSKVGGEHPVPLSATDLSQLLDVLEIKSHDELILLLAGRSNDLAVFFSFIDHALVIGNVKKEGRIARYEYEEDFGRLADQLSDTGEPWFDTFLEGVQRNSEIDTGAAFRMRVGDQWHYPDNKPQLLNHIFLNAIDHLRIEQPRTAAMPIYPLVAYELIGDALGEPVPSYLMQHEAAILANLHANDIERSARRQLQEAQLAQAHIDRDQAREAMAQRMRDNNVKNAVQLHFCTRGYDWQKVVADSADFLLPCTQIGGSTRELQSRILAQLMQTHDRQEISSISHAKDDRDNLCWLRSGWISVFASTMPAYLASRLSMMCTPDMHAAQNAPILGTIAAQFRSNPAAFMHGEPSQHQSIIDTLLQPARLGPASGANFRTDDGVPLPRSNIEIYLKQLQQNLAAAFRFENAAIMNEIESLLMPGKFASSDMLVALHRAFNLPALIVESDTQNNAHGSVDDSLQLRVACSSEGPLFEILKATAESGDQAGFDKTKNVFDMFRDGPIIWLEREHYNVYLPKSATGAP